jgi:hypothetical protein
MISENGNSSSENNAKHILWEELNWKDIEKITGYMTNCPVWRIRATWSSFSISS